MKYYQAVYQTDAHGFNIVYSKNIWISEADAYEYLAELRKLIPDLIHANWVTELFVDTP